MAINHAPGKTWIFPLNMATSNRCNDFKKEGVLDIDKLQTIVLYEADFNFFNKSVGQQAMDNAMQNGCMAMEQYAKPRSSAQDQCIT